MAANYSQYTDHNEIGGVSVGLEDAKLAAADSVDEIASTDCVLMKDASGNPVKILKEDFNEAVRDALGSILSLNPLGTAIGKVAALGSSDNDFGSISTSDLASVQGVACGIQTRLIPFASSDEGLLHVRFIMNDNVYGEVAINPVNMTEGRTPINIMFGVRYDGYGVNAKYIVGTGSSYYKINDGYIDFVFIPTTSIDYGIGRITLGSYSGKVATIAEITRRSGFNLNGYTQI